MAQHEWFQSCTQEMRSYLALEKNSHVKLQHALRASDHLGVPNAYRTAIALELLMEISTTFDRYHGLMSVLLEECRSAIYCHGTEVNDAITTFKAQPGGKHGGISRILFKHKTFFSELRNQNVQNVTLGNEMKHLQSTHDFMMKQLKNKVRSVFKRFILKSC